jgi:hypothetical protein
MANLLDILPAVTHSKGLKDPAITKELQRVQSLEVGLKALEGPAKQGLIDNDAMARAAKIVNDAYSTERERIFSETNRLPKDMKTTRKYSWYSGGEKITQEEGSDKYTFASNLSRTKTSSIIGLADMFNMVVIPFSYLHQDAFTGESEKAINNIRYVYEVMRDLGFCVFVLCPLHYYSPSMHLKASNSNLPIHGGGTTSIALSAITSVLPMFASMKAEIEQLGDKLDTTRKNIDARLGNMQIQIANLAKQVEYQEEQKILAEIAAIKAEEDRRKTEEALTKARAEVERFRFMLFDPMMFWVRKPDLYSEQEALIGPCWGPDFEELLVKMKGISIINNQKKLIVEPLQVIADTNSDYYNRGYKFKV